LIGFDLVLDRLNSALIGCGPCSRVSSQNSADAPETITSRDAARFPIIASCTLFGLYLFFKVSLDSVFLHCCRFQSVTLSMLHPAGVFSRIHQPAAVCLLLRPGRPGSVSHHEVRSAPGSASSPLLTQSLINSLSVSPAVSRIFPVSFPNKQYQLLFTQGSGESKEAVVSVTSQHWIANNLFGLAFALNGVELLHLNNVSTGCILLGGLFVYDVFWLSFQPDSCFCLCLPVVFPQDLLEKGLEASNFAMLGLGDIVIPGIFIALLLRFDVRCLVLDLFSLVLVHMLVDFVQVWTSTAESKQLNETGSVISPLCPQPALLYLVPACVGFPVIVALLKGELTEMFR
ncbi:hypothetical protein XENOCAPTIV_006891, partial [Xenoophorus captivus]